MINVKAKYRYVQMKAVVLYKGVLTLKYVNETLVLDHSNACCRAVISCGTVYHAVKGSFNVQMKPCCVTPLQWKVRGF